MPHSVGVCLSMFNVDVCFYSHDSKNIWQENVLHCSIFLGMIVSSQSFGLSVAGVSFRLLG